MEKNSVFRNQIFGWQGGEEGSGKAGEEGRKGRSVLGRSRVGAVLKKKKRVGGERERKGEGSMLGQPGWEQPERGRSGGLGGGWVGVVAVRVGAVPEKKRRREGIGGKKSGEREGGRVQCFGCDLRLAT